ncbi:MAG: hypothetical protein KBA26_05920 [Candidatus Delongbacteria bacterium]|nr:hypothetical protein [Candidatus Delongbacteria bacterium]
MEIKKISMIGMFMLLLLWGNTIGQAVYDTPSLKRTKTLLEDFVKTHQGSVFEKDAYLRLAEVSFLLELNLTPSTRIAAKSFQEPLLYYRLAEKFIPLDLQTEAAIYGQIYIYYTLIRNRADMKQNYLLMVNKERDLSIMNPRSSYLNSIRLLMAHSLFGAENYATCLEMLKSVRLDNDNWMFARYIEVWANYRDQRDTVVTGLTVQMLDSLDQRIKGPDSDSLKSTLSRELITLFARSFSLSMTPGVSDSFIKTYSSKPYYNRLAYSTGEALMQYQRTMLDGIRIMQNLITTSPGSPEATSAGTLLNQVAQQARLNINDGPLVFNQLGNQQIQLNNLQILGFANVPYLNLYQPKELLQMPSSTSKYNFHRNVLDRYQGYRP